MHRGPLSKLKQEYEEKQKLADSKSPPIKTFVPKITATIPKHDFNPVIKDNKLSDENKSDDEHTLKENSKNAENLKFITEENNGVLPPKPLPRASRTNSVCEATEDVNNVPKPVARPRTNSCAPVVTSVNPNMPVAGGYKVYAFLG